jgi:hypothetical protein
MRRALSGETLFEVHPRFDLLPKGSRSLEERCITIRKKQVGGITKKRMREDSRFSHRTLWSKK